jgi:uncharacterized membrane protein
MFRKIVIGVAACAMAGSLFSLGTPAQADHHRYDHWRNSQYDRGIYRGSYKAQRKAIRRAQRHMQRNRWETNRYMYNPVLNRYVIVR